MKQIYFSLLLFTITIMVGSGLSAQTDCDPNGDGNPNGLDDGQGQGTGGSNNPGDLAWDLLLDNVDCDTDEVLQNGPSAACSNSSSLTPYVLQLQKGAGVKVAIIDSGMRPTRPGHFNEIPLTSYIVSPSGVVTSGVAHPHPHGTFSAGVISGMLLKAKLAVAPHRFYDYQVLDENLRTSLAAVVAAIKHAVSHKVDVISLSIGFVPRECDNMNWEDPASPLFVAINHARQEGVIVVTSAGNDGNDLAVHPQYPAAYTSLENLVSVGALACHSDDRTSFSNYSNRIVDLFTTGEFVRVYYNSCFHEIHGTSFATSIVAGQAAIHFAEDANRSAENVVCLLRSQSRPFPGDQLAIFGIVDVSRDRSVCREQDSIESSGVAKQLERGTTYGLATSPNPFYDQLDLQLEKVDGPTKVSLLDGRGREIMTREVTQQRLQLYLGHLPAGVYWLSVQNSEGRQTRTVVKK